MIRFINWFKGSLEDADGIASFRRIYNWILISLVTYEVLFCTFRNIWSMLTIYVLIVLLVAGFLNTSVITTDNILRFFNRSKEEQSPVEQKATIQGDVTIIPNEKK